MGQSANDEWLAILAHELRSPLATIQYALNVIAGDTAADPSTRQASDVAERQTRRAMQIVDDIFDVCAGALGKLSLNCEPVSLAEIVAVATETTGYLFASRRHKLTVSLPPEPVFLNADSLRLEQVLTNLLANAAKFTDPGGHVRLTAEMDGGQIVLRVRDNGRGIAPDLLPRVFDRHFEAPVIGPQGLRGLGIGLALVRYLVELHGGRVAAASDGLGAGSEFVVRLPNDALGL